MTTLIDLGDPNNPPVVLAFAPVPQLDLNWQPSVVDLPIGVGIQGQRGADGSFNLTLLSGGALGSGRLVVSLAEALTYADSTDASQIALPIYLTLSSATGPGQEVSVMPLGVHQDGSWTFTPDGVLYVGRGGHLTQTVPSVGAGDLYLRSVGQAIAADAIFLSPGPAIGLD